MFYYVTEYLFYCPQRDSTAFPDIQRRIYSQFSLIAPSRDSQRKGMISTRVARRAAPMARRRMSGMKSMFENQNMVHDKRVKGGFTAHTMGKVAPPEILDLILTVTNASIFPLQLFSSIRYKGADNPTYLKSGGMDKVSFGVAVAGATIGVLGIIKGCYSMSFGINKA